MDQTGQQVLGPALLPEGGRPGLGDALARPDAGEAILHRLPKIRLDDAEFRHGMLDPGVRRIGSGQPFARPGILDVVLFVPDQPAVMTAFEQSPNAMLVWADKQTNLRLASAEPPPVFLDEAAAAQAPEQTAGWFQDPTITSGMTQSFNPFFIITLAPLLAFLWVWLDKRKLQPSTPTKMVLGLFLVAVAEMAKL